MKVRRLNEAKYNTVQMAEEAYNAAYGNDRLMVLAEFLEDNARIPRETIKIILNYGIDYVNRWVNAMKWVELGRGNNEFMNLLRMINDHDAPLQSVDSFTKVYNAYSDGSISNDDLKNNFWKNIVIKNNPRLNLYTRSDDEFRDVLRLLNDCIEKGFDESKLTSIFYEGDGKSLKSIAGIEQALKNSGVSTRNNRSQAQNLNDQQAREMIDSLLQRQGIVDYIKQNNLI